jgi:nicotinate phosphoribosyltransferase
MKKNDFVVNSLLQQDLYKITMLFAYFSYFPNVWAMYEFKCRTKNIQFTKEMIDKINKEIEYLCTLRFTDDELDWIQNLYYICSKARGFIEFLRMYKLNKDYIKVSLDPITKGLNIWAQGPLFQVSMFEIFVLQIVNAVYFSQFIKSDDDYDKAWCEGNKRLFDKIKLVQQTPFLFSDFGCRRAFNPEWEDNVVKVLSQELPRDVFGGTSNMYLAKKYNLPAIGTMGHEWIMLFQGLKDFPVIQCNKNALDYWSKLYQGDLGIALTDTLGVDCFLKDFNSYYAKLFDGVRHDSGDPVVWGEKMINHYKKLKVDPMTKMFVFSDGLDFPRAREIYNHFKGKIKFSAGIGTNLCNDLGFEPLNIVYKITRVQNHPVAKISDSEGKGMCGDSDFLDYLNQQIFRKIYCEKI